MPARTATHSRTKTATKRDVLKKKRALLDALPTREAQVLRMRYGIDEPEGAEVAAPPAGTPRAAGAQLEEIEGEVLARARAAAEPETARPASRGKASAKSKILRTLKKT